MLGVQDVETFPLDTLFWKSASRETFDGEKELSRCRVHSFNAGGEMHSAIQTPTALPCYASMHTGANLYTYSRIWFAHLETLGNYFFTLIYFKTPPVWRQYICWLELIKVAEGGHVDGANHHFCMLICASPSVLSRKKIKSIVIDAPLYYLSPWESMHLSCDLSHPFQPLLHESLRTNLLWVKSTPPPTPS